MPPEPDIEQLRVTIESALDPEGVADPDAVRSAVAACHAADVAEVIAELPDEVTHAVLDVLATDHRAAVLAYMTEIDEHAVEGFVEEASVAELVDVVQEMDPDDAADLLEIAEESKAQAVIAAMEREQAAELRQLRAYDPETAGGIMTTEFLSARADDTVANIVQRLRLDHEDIETVVRVLICDDQGRLVGMVRARELLMARPDDRAGNLMERGVVSVVANTDQEECAQLMRKYDFLVLPVVDAANRPLGIITHDDIVEVIDDEAAEDMFRMVGVGDDRPLEHGPFERAWKRLPWLATTLVGIGLVGPLLLHRWFEATLEQIVVLAFFIPAIMGIGGNAASQSATITVRGLATSEIEFGDLWWLMRREAAVAAIVGLVCSVVIVFFAYGVVELGLAGGEVTYSIPRVAVTVGISMFAAVMLAVVVGTLVPMLCHRSGVDPAIAAGPFVTTVIDITAQIIYLALATWLLLG